MKEIKEVDQVREENNQMSLELKYANDTTLISCVFYRLKKATTELEDATKKWEVLK